MTYSIIGRDADTGELGVLIASYYYGCAPRTLAAGPGAGIVVMQMVPDMIYGTTGLARMEAQEDPESILGDLTRADASRQIRQVAMMNAAGAVAAFTGAGCIPYSGHLIGRDCCSQGAMVASDSVWIEAVKQFESTRGPLAERLIYAMRAGEMAGGDIRGRRAAAMLIVSKTTEPSYVKSRPIDIRVDDHEDPLSEVERHLELQRRMGAIELAFERGLSGDVAGAIDDYVTIANSAPDDPDVTMRYGMMLAAGGRVEEARTQLLKMAGIHAGWSLVPGRLMQAGLLPDNPRLRDLSHH